MKCVLNTKKKIQKPQTHTQKSEKKLDQFVTIDSF